jgi:hypothetical protein
MSGYDMRGKPFHHNEDLIVPFFIDKQSKWYKNCQNQRSKKAKICQDCPFREWIETEEKNDNMGRTKRLHNEGMPTRQWGEELDVPWDDD